MRIEARPWAGAAGVLAVFAIAAWLLPGLLGVTGTLAWILRAGLLVFGLLAAILALLYLGARARRQRATEIDGGEDIDQVIAAAEARLEASDQTTESRLGRLPVGLVLGPTGSTKSSILRHSGLDPELLAGEVERGDAVVPTDPINVWYAHGTVLVEAGGRLLEDEARWRRLVRRLLPSRLAAALGRGRQAPRFAILCIACDEFLKPGSTQSLAVTARQLRTRVGEVSQQLGVKLPVYVLLTRADRVPFFTDYV
ncbi:MAG: type VI secretion protein IcmF/TssM N-terminal domain-containing protein, partial [Longimicrobiales bacterium]